MACGEREGGRGGIVEEGMEEWGVMDVFGDDSSERLLVYMCVEDSVWFA